MPKFGTAKVKYAPQPQTPPEPLISNLPSKIEKIVANTCQTLFSPKDPPPQATGNVHDPKKSPLEKHTKIYRGKPFPNLAQHGNTTFLVVISPHLGQEPVISPAQIKTIERGSNPCPNLNPTWKVQTCITDNQTNPENTLVINKDK